MVGPARSMAPEARRGRRGLLALLLAGALALPPVLGGHGAEAASGPACDAAPMAVAFGDVPSSGTFADAIACVTGYGLVSGYDDGRFQPGERVSRGEAAAFLVDTIETATGVQLPDAGSNPYSDVDSSGVFGQAILRLVQAGVMSGRSSSRFRPEDSLTRGEMSKAVTRALQTIAVRFDSTAAGYPDVPDDGLFAVPINKLTNARIVQGLSDGTFRPGNTVTRGQLAQFVAKGLEEAHRQAHWLPTLTDPDWTTLRGTLEHRRISLPGPRVVNVLRWRLDDPSVELDADYAGGVTYRDTVLHAATRENALAAVNGGFWVNSIDPDGLLVRGGRLDSDTSVLTDGTRSIRSGFALHRDGSPVVGVPFWYASLNMEGPDGIVSVRVDGVNRAPFAGDKVVIFAPGTYGQLTSRPGRYYVVDGRPDLNRAGTTELSLARMHVGDGPVAASADEAIIWVSAETTLREVPDDRTPTLRVQMDPAWERSRTGLVAGPWLLEDGQVTPEAQWRREGFTGAHTDVRHPRSAIGFTPDGWGVIVTVDGRRPGATIGATHLEVAQMMRGWGVTDAVMLDGGGSTQMVVGGQLANRPCCDRSERRVDTVLTLEPR